MIIEQHENWDLFSCTQMAGKEKGKVGFQWGTLGRQMKKGSNKKKFHFPSLGISFLIIFAVFLAFILYLSTPLTSVVHVEVIPEKKSYFQIFWAKDVPKFKEAHSNGCVINRQKRTLTIKSGNLHSANYLRIDPLKNRGTVTIKRIEITQLGFEPIIFETKKHFEEFVPNRHIGKITCQDNGLQITSIGNDPSLYIKITPSFRIVLFIKNLITVRRIN
jgi:hypothetical protein